MSDARDLKLSANGRNSNRSSSPLWTKALERYRLELEETEDYQIVNEVHSLDDLLQHVSKLHPVLRDRNTLLSLNRLGPRLKFVDDFSAVIALCFGANATLTALLWGSIRLIVTLASSPGDTLREVLDMLEDLSLTLPRFRLYEETLPMNRGFEHALIDVYTEVICLYARAIHFFRSHPHVLLQKTEWAGFHIDFSRTIQRIKRISNSVETEADLARMRVQESKYKEVLELMESLSASKQVTKDVLQFRHLPSLINHQCWCRDPILESIGQVLDPDQDSSTLKSLALFGMGGVGKTRLALQYAHRNLNKYDVVLWIAADNSIALGQSFRDIAEGLSLVSNEDEGKDASAAVFKVKSWLMMTSKSPRYCSIR
jgi:hypothetical protein